MMATMRKLILGLLIALLPVLCLLAGAGWGIQQHREAQQAATRQAQQSQENFSLLGEPAPEELLPALLEGIGQADVVGVCGLLMPEARAEFVQAAQASDCPGAVEHFHAVLPRVPPLRHLDAPIGGAGDDMAVDGCRTLWASGGLGGSALGVVDVYRAPPPGQTYFIGAFKPCPVSTQ